MPWYAHAWLAIPLLGAIAFLLVLGLAFGWVILILAVVCALAVFLVSRRWAQRRFGGSRERSDIPRPSP